MPGDSPSHASTHGTSAGPAAPDTAATAVPGSQAAPAPWGTVCLALLRQRCSDKAAAVRAKALGGLAEVVRGALEGRQGGDAEGCRNFRQARYLPDLSALFHP